MNLQHCAIFIVLTLCIVISGASAGILDNNVWPNSRLEQASTAIPNEPNEWNRGGNDWNNNTYPYATFWVEDTNLSPTHSLAIIDTDLTQSFDWYSNSIPILAGTSKVTIRWNWKAQDIQGDPGSMQFLWLQRNASNTVVTQGYVSASGTFDWKEETITLPVAPNVTKLSLSLRGLFYYTKDGASVLSVGTTGSLWVDDISVSVMKCTAQITGDFNSDCKLDFKDFAIIAANWLQCNRDPQSLCAE